jgi:type IV secretion system protein VirB6
MACSAILTGSRFLSSTLTHLDCQGQAIGAYGYGALADPTSSVVLALTGLLTFFMALFGIRLLLGGTVGVRDVVGEVIRIGIVLTLATSWPAWRTIGYDLVTRGPDEIVSSIGNASGLPTNATLVARLQNLDDGLIAMTTFGTGRLTGDVTGGSDRGDSFHGVAIGDEAGFGWGRVFFLVGTIGPFAIVRLGAGILLALAPLMAGLMLFGQTLGLFMGWLRGLAFVFFASVTISLIEGVELAVLAPWINDVLAHREAKLFTPSAPTELLVLALAFAMVSMGALTLAARVVFMPHGGWMGLVSRGKTSFAGSDGAASPSHHLMTQNEPRDGLSRAQSLAQGVAGTMRREAAGGFLAQLRERDAVRERKGLDALRGGIERSTAPGETLGNSFRRTQRRVSGMGMKRDQPG